MIGLFKFKIEMPQITTDTEYNFPLEGCLQAIFCEYLISPHEAKPK